MPARLGAQSPPCRDARWVPTCGKGPQGWQELHVAIRGLGVPIDDGVEGIVSNEEEYDEHDSERNDTSLFFPCLEHLRKSL